MRALFASLLAVVAVAGAAFAETPEPVKLSTTVVTNSATLQVSNMATSDAVFYGCLDYIVLDLGGYALATVRVDVVTASGRAVPSRTLLSVTAAAADGTFAPRLLAVNTANAASTDTYAEIPLYNDKLVLHAYNALATNAITVDAYIFVK